MAETKEYDVLSQHDGDKQYWKGDTRTAIPADVKHLVELGVLREKKPKAKAEEPAKNKAEKAPANK